MNGKKRGVTLVELLMCMSFFVVIISITTSIHYMNRNRIDKSFAETELQNEMDFGSKILMKNLRAVTKLYEIEGENGVLMKVDILTDVDGETEQGEFVSKKEGKVRSLTLNKYKNGITSTKILFQSLSSINVEYISNSGVVTKNLREAKGVKVQIVLQKIIRNEIHTKGKEFYVYFRNMEAI